MRSFWPTAILVIAALPCSMQAKDLSRQVAVAVTNTSAYERTDRVEIDSPFDVEKTRGVIVSDGKRSFPGQVIGDRIAFVARDVPAKACRLFWISPAGNRSAGRVSGKRWGIENEYVRVAVDEKTGAISGIYSKLAGRQFVARNSQACAFEITRGGKAETAKLQEIDLIESGPARAMIRSEWEFGTSRIVQDLAICEAIPRIDVKVTVDWQEGSDTELKIALPAVVRNGRAWTGPRVGASGSVWVDVSGRDEGITVVGDGRSPVAAEGDVIKLLVAPSERPAAGMIELAYSIFPHPGGFNPSLTEQIVDTSTTPLRAAVGAKCTED